MALRFIDSFDHYDIANDSADKYDSVNSPASASGRLGGSAVQFNATDANTKILDAQATWIVGFGLKCEAAGNGDMVFLRFLDGATLHLDLRRASTTSFLVATRNGTTLATGTHVINLDTWYYIEVKVTIDDSTGVFQVHIDGVQDINFSGDTRNAGNASADRIEIRSANATPSSTFDFDDLYVLDGTGSAPSNARLGDVRVEALYPNGNGNSSQLVGSDGNSTDNYLLVDENPPNDDTDYVESSTVGDKDTYAMTDATPTTGTVFGVQPVPYSRKTDAGTRKICSVARLSGTEADSADKTLNTAYKFQPDIRETKPGGGAWTLSDVNSAEFGVKVTA